MSHADPTVHEKLKIFNVRTGFYFLLIKLKGQIEPVIFLFSYSRYLVGLLTNFYLFDGLTVIYKKICTVVSIEFSPLSSVELTNSWYQLHNGDYKGILEHSFGKQLPTNFCNHFWTFINLFVLSGY